MQHTFYIQHVNLFDGHNVIPDSSILVQDGIIAAVNAGTPPTNAEILDGTGKTLLPGLIDAHTHVFGSALKEALIFGVTTELDMFTDYHMVAEVKRQQAAGRGLDMADLLSAGTAVTAPHGHCTEYGIPIPTITGPDEAQDFVDARITESSDYIKIIYDDGRATGRTIPTISKETMAAVVAATHKRGKLAVVHTLTLQEARDAIEVGADGLAHLFVDQPDAEFGTFVAQHHAFIIPTLTVLEGFVRVASGASLVDDSRLSPYLTRETIALLKTTFPPNPAAPKNISYAFAEEAIQQLKAANVPLLAGTDAPNPGTSHGASIHRELELLVQAGLTPQEALSAATSVPARIFNLADRGRIAPQLRADLVLVNGDPTTDIHATRDIVSIWKQGVPVDRESYRVQVEQQRREYEQRSAPVGSESGLVSDFEDGTTRTLFGAGWSITTDAVRGGKSTARYEVVPDGANGSKYALHITGEIVPGLPFAWAGAMFHPAAQQWTPANLSDKHGLSFWAKGDGRTYNATFYSGSLMAMPVMVPFVAGPHWQEFHVDFAEHSEVNMRELLGVSFAANAVPGKFELWIDDVRFV